MWLVSIAVWLPVFFFFFRCIFFFNLAAFHKLPASLYAREDWSETYLLFFYKWFAEEKIVHCAHIRMRCPPPAGEWESKLAKQQRYYDIIVRTVLALQYSFQKTVIHIVCGVVGRFISSNDAEAFKIQNALTSSCKGQLIISNMTVFVIGFRMKTSFSLDCIQWIAARAIVIQELNGGIAI